MRVKLKVSEKIKEERKRNNNLNCLTDSVKHFPDVLMPQGNLR